MRAREQAEQEHNVQLGQRLDLELLRLPQQQQDEKRRLAFEINRDDESSIGIKI